MKRTTKRLATGASLAVAALFAIAIPAQAEALSCGDTITTSTTLTEDLDCSTGGSDGLYIDGDGITLDLGGHTITGAGGDDGYEGIEVINNDNVTIENGTIKFFQDGVLFQNVSNSTVQGVAVNSDVNDDATAYDGIRSTYGSGNTFSGNKFQQPLHGIYLAKGSGNIVQDNKFNYPTEGIHSEYESYDRIRRNTTKGLTVSTYGSWSDHDYMSRFSRNVMDRGYEGLYATFPMGTVFNHNEATGNGSAGIYVENNDPAFGYSAKIRNTTANGNNEYGIYSQFGSAGKNNVAIGNGYYNCYRVSCNGTSSSTTPTH